MKKLIVFLLGVVLFGVLLPRTVLAEEVSEPFVDETAMLQDVSLDSSGDMEFTVSPFSRGGCYTWENLGRIPKGYCDGITVSVTPSQKKCLINMFGTSILSSFSGNVITMAGSMVLVWYNNCRFM